MSITPILSNFTGPTKSPDTDTLGSLTDVKTPVQGQGPISWHVEDINGVQSTIDTVAYWVPSAIIRLFSPQIYTKPNPTASLYLDKDGTYLTLATGIHVHFPVQANNNLPFMLTQKAISSQHKSNKLPHSANVNIFQNIFNLLFSSTHDLFRNSTVDVSTSKQFLAPADDAIFKIANWNLTPAQKELILWHYRLDHLAMPHV